MCSEFECNKRDKCIMSEVCVDIVCPAFMDSRCDYCINNNACSTDRKRTRHERSEMKLKRV